MPNILSSHCSSMPCRSTAAGWRAGLPQRLPLAKRRQRFWCPRLGCVTASGWRAWVGIKRASGGRGQSRASGERRTRRRLGPASTARAAVFRTIRCRCRCRMHICLSEQWSAARGLSRLGPSCISSLLQASSDRWLIRREVTRTLSITQRQQPLPGPCC